MSVNNKRVFYVKYLAHDIYAEIMKGRPDVRLDRLENESPADVFTPILGAATNRQSFALCEASGVVRVLASGNAQPITQLQLSTSPQGKAAAPASERWSHCALAAGRGWPPAPSAGDEQASAEALVEQLARVLASSDPDLANVQRFLSRELAVRPEPEATRVLIALASRWNADEAATPMNRTATPTWTT